MKNRTKETSVEAVLYTYYTRKNADPKEPSRHPVRIRVTNNRKSRFYPVQFERENIFLSVDEWGKIKSEERPRGRNRKLQDSIDVVTAAAKTAAETVNRKGTFTFDRFSNEFLHKDSAKGFIALFDNYLDGIKKEGRIGTFKAYKNAQTALKKFIGSTPENKKELNPVDLTAEKLKDFDAYLRDRTVGKSGKKVGKTTVGIYMRSLKAVYNYAISKDPALQEHYPFAKKQKDKGKYTIKTGSGKKGEALSLEELQAFIATTPIETSNEWEAKLLWMFSFYGQGMNFRDIALLKYREIELNKRTISYVRQKTRETEREEAQMIIPLSDQLHEIILKLGNADKRPDAFVFNILTQGMDALRQDDTIRQKIKQTNKYLKALCEANNLPAITTYWARHSYANLLKQSGESIDMIKELLGHSDPRTTEAYLKRFDTNKKREVNERLHSILKAS